MDEEEQALDLGAVEAYDARSVVEWIDATLAERQELLAQIDDAKHRLAEARRRAEQRQKRSDQVPLQRVVELLVEAQRAVAKMRADHDRLIATIRQRADGPVMSGDVTTTALHARGEVDLREPTPWAGSA